MLYIFHVTCGYDYSGSPVRDCGVFKDFERAMAQAVSEMEYHGESASTQSMARYGSLNVNGEWEWEVDEYFYRIVRREVK